MQTPELRCMEPILRLLQLFCENHNTDMQNYVREQTKSKKTYNLVLDTLKLLDSICGITTGGLVLLSLYVHSDNCSLINQSMTTLTEYCQGPCYQNQVSSYIHTTFCLQPLDSSYLVVILFSQSAIISISFLYIALYSFQ